MSICNKLKGLRFFAKRIMDIPEEGSVLICCSKPKTNTVVEV